MSRKEDPNTKYRVRTRKDKGYLYASVQENYTNPKSGKRYPRTINLGTLDGDKVFTPNATFRLMSAEERRKYIFPTDWDISKADSLNAVPQTAPAHVIEEGVADSSVAAESSVTPPEDGNAESPLPSDTTLDQYNNRLYGAFWLLEQIARKSGLYDDLVSTFGGNYTKVHAVLSLAFYPYLSGRSYGRFARWQNANKTLLDYRMTASAITRLAQSITDDERMRLISLRFKRLPRGSRLDIDSTTRSAWGRCLADIRWGRNKDNPKLRNTVEATVYSLTTHEPVYYRSFPGNTSDMSTIRTVLSDLRALGVGEVSFITDRGYTSDENTAAMVAAGLPFIMCSKTCGGIVLEQLKSIKYDDDGIPSDMEYDEKNGLYHTQKRIPAHTAALADGTPVRMDGLMVNLFLDPHERVDGLSLLKRRKEREREELERLSKDGFIPKAIKKFNALFDYFKVTLERAPDGKPIGIRYRERGDKSQKERAACGFFSSLMYGMELTSGEALQAYRNRDEHEKNFDQMKNQMNFRVQRCSSEDGKNGMSFIMFVGLIATSILRNAWCQSMTDDYDTALDMLDEMEPIRLSEYTNGSVHMTSFTTKQVMISRACGIEPPQECIPQSIRRDSDVKAQNNN